MSASAPPEPEGKRRAPAPPPAATSESAPVDASRRHRWLGLAGIAVGAMTMVAALALAIHVHQHERAIESAVEEMRALQDKNGSSRLPPEDLALLRQALAAPAARPEAGGVPATRAVDGAAASALVEATLAQAPALFGQAEQLLAKGDVASARKAYCRFLAAAGEVRGANADWVARARFRVLECDARLAARRVEPAPSRVERRS
jgi:hypothetical protein